jgi:hypothetical protein
MSEAEFAFGGFLLRLDGDVFEMFGHRVLDSVRIPAAWTVVDLEARKGDVIRVRVGIGREDAAGVYDSKNMVFGGPWSFDMPATEEPRLRAFLAAVDAASGRT